MVEKTERIVLADLDAGVRGAVAAARERVAGLHGELIRWGLVVWTAGNVSERVVVTRADGSVERTGLFVIKPSGVAYDELCADNMVVCTLDGDKVVDGTPEGLVPSSDTAAHAYVYRHMDGVGGVVHTHSTYAT
ncbi:L-ribulose-5-phosphate 4-epimerase, partial [Actinomyces ruminicola]